MIINAGRPFPLGATKDKNGINFSFVCGKNDECRLVINNAKTGEETIIILDDTYRTGDVVSVLVDIDEKDLSDITYIYQVNGDNILDPYAYVVKGRKKFGCPSENVRCGLYFKEYDWDGDIKLNTSFADMIMYRLHVRGFSMKAPLSDALNCGTYEGVVEMIPYMKDLGINAVLFLPVYDFDEEMKAEKTYGIPERLKKQLKDNEKTEKVNYWGYTPRAAYFAPKASYSKNPDDVVDSFKNMVKALHKAGISIFLDMHFSENEDCRLILDCLKHWVYNYHIDGFKINQSGVPEELIKRDKLLASTKFITTFWNRNNISDRYADYNDGAMNNIRRFILAGEGESSEYVKRFLPDARGVGCIRYIADINGFTLMDMVSYEMKHNEANGENNFDGTNYNYSSNYGAEGPTDKKDILDERMAQIKNALTLLFMSYGTPMILSGDEIGNSAKGNNNPYCQDNDISYIDWEYAEDNKEIKAFVKELISLRKDVIIDKGEVSFHGKLPWKVDYSPGCRCIAVLAGGGHAYIAINMNSHAEKFSLPEPVKGEKWKLRLSTRKMSGNVIPGMSIGIFVSTRLA